MVIRYAVLAALTIAGSPRPPDQLFTEDTLNLIHTVARGYPRAVNNLALQSLVAAFASGKNLVDDTAARSAVTEVVDGHHRHHADRDQHLTDENPTAATLGGVFSPRTMQPSAKRIQGQYNPEVVHSRSRRRGN